MEKLLRLIRKNPSPDNFKKINVPPYKHIANEWSERASSVGGDVLRRYNATLEMKARGGMNCIARTLAFTHPDYADKYDMTVEVLGSELYEFAKELVEITGESLERDYFGRLEDPIVKKIDKSDLENHLREANAVWFCTTDIRGTNAVKPEGYNHIFGVIPGREYDKYIVYDTSGYLNPLTPLSIDTIFEEILQLPVGTKYVQSIFSFR